jgi:hypothetical protein
MAPSALKDKLQRILASLPSVDSLPKLNAPNPYPGTLDQVRIDKYQPHSKT